MRAAAVKALPSAAEATGEVLCLVDASATSPQVDAMRHLTVESSATMTSMESSTPCDFSAVETTPMYEKKARYAMKA